MGIKTSQTILLSRAAELFPGLADMLSPINEALRRINMGRMEFLPYDHPVAGYRVHMRAELTPQGPNRPPQVGHWQLEIQRDDAPHVLYLQGKAGADGELGELVSPEDTPPAPGSSP